MESFFHFDKVEDLSPVVIRISLIKTCKNHIYKGRKSF